MEKKRKTRLLNFAVTEHEEAVIQKKMHELGIKNQSAFLRAMALNGYLLKLDLTEIRELTRLLSNMSGNINQIAKRVNSGGHLYETEMDEIKTNQAELWKIMKEILRKLQDVR